MRPILTIKDPNGKRNETFTLIFATLLDIDEKALGGDYGIREQLIAVVMGWAHDTL